MREQRLEMQIFLTPELVFFSILHFSLKCTVGSTKCPIRRGKGLTLGVHFQLAEISAELTDVQGRRRMPQGQSKANAMRLEKEAIPGTKQPAAAPLNKSIEDLVPCVYLM